MSNYLAIAWPEQVTFQCYDDASQPLHKRWEQVTFQCYDDASQPLHKRWGSNLAKWVQSKTFPTNTIRSL
jgi:hypothetical protein